MMKVTCPRECGKATAEVQMDMQKVFSAESSICRVIFIITIFKYFLKKI